MEVALKCPCGGELKALKYPTPSGHTHQCLKCGSLHAPHGIEDVVEDVVEPEVGLKERSMVKVFDLREGFDTPALVGWVSSIHHKPDKTVVYLDTGYVLHIE